MYSCDVSRYEGADKATTRNTRGLTRSVIALMVPPLPAPSRPSNTIMIRKPLNLTHSWSLQSSACNRRSSFFELLTLELWLLVTVLSFRHKTSRLMLAFSCTGLRLACAPRQSEDIATEQTSHSYWA